MATFWDKTPMEKDLAPADDLKQCRGILERLKKFVLAKLPKDKAATEDTRQRAQELIKHMEKVIVPFLE